jgi:uncharacterized membrane protein YhaH (DUF805 family)
MRRWWAVVRATAFEVLSDPLAFLTSLSALVLATIAPGLHYHQFGEPSRMARDAGLSAMLVGGLVVGVFCTVKTIRREIDSGTLQMALAHRVSRRAFFLCKLAGCALACLACEAILFASVVTTVNGAEIGGRLAAKTGDIARLWGPSLAWALTPLSVAPAAAAALNRFARCRFVPTAILLMAVCAFAGLAYRFDGALAARLLPVAATLLLPVAVFVAAAGAFAMRWRENAATSLAGLLFAVMLPALGGYYLSDALVRGGTLPWSHVALALALTAPLVAAFAELGCAFSETFEAGD